MSYVGLMLLMLLYDLLWGPKLSGGFSVENSKFETATKRRNIPPINHIDW